MQDNEAEYPGKEETWPEAVTVVLERRSESGVEEAPEGGRHKAIEEGGLTGHRTQSPVEPGGARPRHLNSVRKAMPRMKTRKQRLFCLNH